MASVGGLADAELRHKLAEFGFPVGPVTETSRRVLIKKLKHLMAQAGRSSDASATDKWRRSSSRFSSGEEESENEDSKNRLNSSMPPPSSDYKSLRRKSASKTQNPTTPIRLGRRKEINLRSDLFDTARTSTPESEPSKMKRSRFSAPAIPLSSSGTRRSPSRASNILKDGFDTGSDSDIDNQKWSSFTRPVSPSAQENSPYTSSFVSRLSSGRSKQKSDGAGDSSSVNTLLGFRKLHHTSDTVNSPDIRYTSRTSTAPFQSNFVKRLSGSSTITSSGGPSSIFDVKENDDMSLSANGLFSQTRSTSPPSRTFISQEFKIEEDEGRFGWNSQLLSKLLVFFVALFFTCLAILYVTVRSGEGVTFTIEDKSNYFPVCPTDLENSDIPYDPHMICIEKNELLPAIKMVKLVHPELQRRAIAHHCEWAETDFMTHFEILKYVMGKDKKEAGQLLENYLKKMKVLVLSNPHWGIVVFDARTGVTGEDSSHHSDLIHHGSLTVSDPALPLMCYLKLKLFGLFPAILITVGGLIVMFLVKRYIKYSVRRKEREKLNVFNLVERIVDNLMRYQQDSPNGRPAFIPVNRLRDEMIPPMERKSNEKLWEEAAKYIRTSESRIRCEKQKIRGEPCEVWCWVPLSVTRPPGPSKESPPVGSHEPSPVIRRCNKVWQGQAFDTMSGSPNSLPCSPTPCLKIRHMFEPEMEFAEDWPVRIEDAVLEKCGEQNVRALHISVDRTNREGCVYLKCASQEDAGRAYQALHGWWFDSHLVTVKYLRLERYHERFPEAAGATVPLCPSNNQKLSLQWQGSLEVN